MISRTWFFVVCVLLSVMCVVTVVLLIRLAEITIRSGLAAEQVELFDDMREQSQQAGVPAVVAHLRYVRLYYRSGTKQLAGSRLDQLVESARAGAVRAIVQFIRSRADVDLGTDPEVWERAFLDKGASGQPVSE